MKIIAVEDEPIALKQIIKMLEEMRPDAEILGREKRYSLWVRKIT